ncbi:unnamed protein product [Protopolystoma xenopodis]|uniref:Uncharacterized protein n=1 Tax=Protopolystoma xenopodis TaxID=117903 RepID=A0A3S5CN42_9PLAT|nr:unnamed protein product [Protopolystoma xenopodis]
MQNVLACNGKNQTLCCRLSKGPNDPRDFTFASSSEKLSAEPYSFTGLPFTGCNCPQTSLVPGQQQKAPAKDTVWVIFVVEPLRHDHFAATRPAGFAKRQSPASRCLCLASSGNLHTCPERRATTFCFSLGKTPNLRAIFPFP